MGVFFAFGSQSPFTMTVSLPQCPFSWRMNERRETQSCLTDIKLNARSCFYPSQLSAWVFSLQSWLGNKSYSLEPADLCTSCAMWNILTVSLLEGEVEWHQSVWVWQEVLSSPFLSSGSFEFGEFSQMGHLCEAKLASSFDTESRHGCGSP